MNGEALFLADIIGYDRSLGATRTLRFANRAFTTKPSESPASTPYALGLEQPSSIGRSLFGSARTRGRSTMSVGDLVLLNPDGELDYLNELAFDTRTVTIRRTTVFNPSYPADFDSVVLTMEQPVWDNARITIKLRDRFYEVVNTPLQATKYLGNNVLPAGVEGTIELKGKPKPVCFGLVKNVPAVPVNTSKLIYQVNDGAVDEVTNVYDRGVALRTNTTWVTNGASGNYGYVAFANGLFIAGDFAAGVLKTSPDGQTWTTRKTGLGTIKAVAYGAGKWLAVTTGELVTSTDGVTWTTQTVPTLQASNFFEAATYHEIAGLFVIGGTGGEIYTSPNATTWTQRAAGTSSSGLGTLNPNGLYAGGYLNGIAVLGGVGGLVLSSPDAIVWTKRTENTTIDGFNGAIFAFTTGLDRIVAVGVKIILASLDGVTWTRIDVDETFVGAMYANVFIAPVASGNTIYSSVDGFKWIETKAPWGIAGFGCAANGNVSVIAGITLLKSVNDTYASLADLLNDDLAPLAGSYTEYAAGGYFRLGSSPDGIVTADVTEGATAADRTAAAIADRVLGRIASTPSFDAGDLTALDADDNSELGYWTMDEGVTCDQVLDFIAGTPGAAWYPDKASNFRIARFEEPSGTPLLTITKDDIKRDSLKRITSNDQGNGIPIYQVVVQWGRFYQTIATDIAGAVSDAARAEFAQEWRNAPATDLSVLVAHPSAGVLTIQSAYTTEADALAEANRQLALRKVKRDPYELTIELNDETSAIDLNSVVEIAHPRYSLSVVSSPSGAIEGGGLFRVLDVRPNAEAKELTLTVWGGARYKNVIDKNGALVLDKNGAFVIARVAA